MMTIIIVVFYTGVYRNTSLPDTAVGKPPARMCVCQLNSIIWYCSISWEVNRHTVLRSVPRPLSYSFCLCLIEPWLVLGLVTTFGWSTIPPIFQVTQAHSAWSSFCG